MTTLVLLKFSTDRLIGLIHWLLFDPEQWDDWDDSTTAISPAEAMSKAYALEADLMADHNFYVDDFGDEKEWTQLVIEALNEGGIESEWGSELDQQNKEIALALKLSL